MITIIKNKFLHFSIGILLIIVSYKIYTIAETTRDKNYFEYSLNTYKIASILISFAFAQIIPVPKNIIGSWLIRIFAFVLSCFLFFMVLIFYIFSSISFD